MSATGSNSLQLFCHDFQMHLLKALILCFAECFTNQNNTALFPKFDINVLHVLSQWQCIYNDAIHLNQLLMLPLPYISPALLFDGQRVTHYCQVPGNYLDMYCHKVFELYNLLFVAVQDGIK